MGETCSYMTALLRQEGRASLQFFTGAARGQKARKRKMISTITKNIRGSSARSVRLVGPSNNCV